MSLPKLRVFISSPGDVDTERKIAARVIGRLAAEFRGRLDLDAYFWEDEPMVHHRTFQEQIPHTSEFDLVLCILWSRLGTPLRGPDGREYPSGTDYEVESARSAYERTGKPELMIYFNQTPAQLRQVPREERERMVRQLEALEGFVERHCVQRETGVIKGAFTSYRDLGQFEDLLEKHLRKLITAKLPVGDSPATFTRPAEITWHGRPYQGLRAFDFEQAPIFFGRTRATGEVLALLRKRAVGLEEARAAAISGISKGIDPAAATFVLVCAMSGVGKSSLVRAGVLPLLTQPGGGIGLWRRVMLRPSETPAGGDLFDALAQESTKPNGLPELLSGGVSLQELAFMLRQNPTGIELLLKQALSQAAESARATEAVRLQEEARACREAGRTNDVERLDAQRLALSAPPARLAVVIDQMEELFTLDGITPELRRRFVQALAALARSGWVWVIGTLRSDFFGRCAEVPELMELKAQGLYDLQPPSPEELGQMIRRPAQAAGLVFECHRTSDAALDEALRDAALRSPEALPLLEFALDQLYERSLASSGLLTWKAYEEIDGIEGALAVAADEALRSLEPWSQEVFDHVIGGLVTLGTGQQETPHRRTAYYAELTRPTGAQAFVDKLIDARLLVADHDTAGRPIVSIAHEALLSQKAMTAAVTAPPGSNKGEKAENATLRWRWQRLGEWVEANADFLRMRARVAAHCTLWKDANQDEGSLAQDRVLAEGCALLADHRANLDPAEIEFIRRSRAKAEAKTRDRLRKLRMIAAGFAALALTASAGALLAWLARAEARHRQQQVQHVLATSDFSRAQELFDAGEAPGGLVFLARAAEADPVHARAPVERLWAALTQRAWPLAISAPMRHGGALLTASFSADGSRVVTAGGDGMTRLWASEDGLPIGEPLRQRGSVRCAVFTPDGRRLLTGCFDGSVRLWDISTGQPVPGWSGAAHGNEVNSMALSPGGRWAATGARDGSVYVWDVSSGERLAVLPHRENVHTVEFCPADEALLLTASEQTLRLWSVPQGKLLFEGRHDADVRSARFSPDGKHIVTASDDKTARVWDLAPDGQSAATTAQIFLDAEVRDACFNAAGDLVATASGTQARLWRTDGSPLVSAPLSHHDAVTALRFSPDGQRLLTGCRDGRAQVWAASTGEPLGEPVRAASAILTAAFHPDGRRVLLTTSEGEARVWRTASFSPVAATVTHPGAVSTLAVSMDGQRLAVAGANGSVILWDLSRQPPVARSLPHPAPVLSVAFSADGRFLATGAADATARLWPVTPPGVAPLLLPHGAAVCAVAFSADDRWLATATETGTAQTWSLPDGRAQGQPMTHAGRVTALAFSGDGTLLLTAADGAARLWHTGTGVAATVPLRGEDGTDLLCGALSPTEGIVAVGTRAGNVLWWNAATGTPYHEPLRHRGAVLALAFSRDGRRLATASEDATAALWDVASGRPVCDALRHPSAVTAVAFTPDARHLATTTEDGLARLWDVESGQPLSEWMSGTRGQPVCGLAFGREGKTLFTGDDHRVRIWDLTVPLQQGAPSLTAFACALAAVHLQESGRLEPDAAQTADALRAAARALRPALDGSLLDWMFADPAQRPLTPYAAQALPAYLAARLEEGTPAALDEAERLANGEPGILSQIARLRKNQP